MTENPFLITIYDKGFVRKGWIGNAISLTVIPRHNLVSGAKFTIDADHPRVLDLTAKGARVTIDYLGSQLVSGPVRLSAGNGPSAQSTVEFTVEGDLRVLYGLLAWPVPGNSISSQGTGTGYYQPATANLETIAKNLVAANAGRLGIPLTNAANLGRGPSTSGVKLRFPAIADALIPLMEAAGYGLSVKQSGSGLVFDIYQPATVAQTLSETSGVLVDWAWSAAAPTATRVVVAGQGEGTLRTFIERIDGTREADWGDKIEVFRDARDADNTTLLQTRGDETLLDGAPKSGLSLTLAETDGFRYGTTVRVGDQVTVAVAPGVTITDLLREVTLSWTRNDGLQVTPVVGEKSDDPSRALAKTVAAIARGVRNLTTGR